jgi:hypothetical protein
VAGDVKTVWLSQSSVAEIYVPIDSGTDGTLSVVIRTDNEAGAIRALADTAARINPNGPPVAAESMASIVARSEQRRWFYSVLVSLFAFLSVAVSIVGVSGAVAQVVALRSKEMGIRVALGARPSKVVWLVMRQGLRPATLGVLAGAVAAWSAIPPAPEECEPSALLTDSAPLLPVDPRQPEPMSVSGATRHARSATAQAHDIAEQSCLRTAHSALSNSRGSTRSTLTIEGTEARSATAVIMARPTGMSVE